MTDIRSIATPTIFSRALQLSDSTFLKAPHPKTSIRPDRIAIQKILDRGWVAQFKIHGHRAQIHIPSLPEQAIIVYNRHGRPHKAKLDDCLDQELRRLFSPETGWNVVDAEWLKSQKRIFLFDVLRFNGEVLNKLSYEERYNLLPRIYRSDHVETLGLIHSARKCLEMVEEAPPFVEGLVLKSLQSKGFHDTSIIRCRFPGRSPH